jgi:hypothetical protein
MLFYHLIVSNILHFWGLYHPGRPLPHQKFYCAYGDEPSWVAVIDTESRVNIQQQYDDTGWLLILKLLLVFHLLLYHNTWEEKLLCAESDGVIDQDLL